MKIEIPDTVWNMLEDEARHFNREDGQTGLPSGEKHTPQSLAVHLIAGIITLSRQGRQYTFFSAYSPPVDVEILDVRFPQDEGK